MYPLMIGLVVETKQLWEEIQAILQALPFRIVLEQSEVGDWPTFLSKLERLRPEVLLFDISKSRDSIEEQLQHIRSLASPPVFIAVDSKAEPETILRAIRAGAAEFVYPPVSAPLRAALEKLAEQKSQQQHDTKGNGRVAAFLSAKGGCGATTIAVHTAVEVPALTNSKVLLADLDLESGLISFLMKATAPYSMLDAIHNLHRLDPSFWKGLVSNGRPGIEIVGSASTPNYQEIPRADQLRDVLRFVRMQYSTVLLDLGRSLTPMTLSALEHEDMTFLVATLEVPALHRAQHIVRALLNGGYSKDRLHVILNRMPKNPDITISELESMLGVPIFQSVPNDYPALYECYAEGKLLPAGNRLARCFGEVASKITGVEASKPKKKFSIF